MLISIVIIFLFLLVYYNRVFVFKNKTLLFCIILAIVIILNFFLVNNRDSSKNFKLKNVSGEEHVFRHDILYNRYNDVPHIRWSTKHAWNADYLELMKTLKKHKKAAEINEKSNLWYKFKRFLCKKKSLRKNVINSVLPYSLLEMGLQPYLLHHWKLRLDVS